MDEKKEFEIVTHTVMNYLELFVVEMTSRCPHGHDDLEIGILLKGALCLFMTGRNINCGRGISILSIASRSILFPARREKSCSRFPGTFGFLPQDLLSA